MVDEIDENRLCVIILNVDKLIKCCTKSSF